MLSLSEQTKLEDEFRPIKQELVRKVFEQSFQKRQLLFYLGFCIFLFIASILQYLNVYGYFMDIHFSLLTFTTASLSNPFLTYLDIITSPQKKKKKPIILGERKFSTHSSKPSSRLTLTRLFSLLIIYFTISIGIIFGLHLVYLHSFVIIFTLGFPFGVRCLVFWGWTITDNDLGDSVKPMSVKYVLYHIFKSTYFSVFLPIICLKNKLFYVNLKMVFMFLIFVCFDIATLLLAQLISSNFLIKYDNLIKQKINDNKLNEKIDQLNKRNKNKQKTKITKKKNDYSFKKRKRSKSASKKQNPMTKKYKNNKTQTSTISPSNLLFSSSFLNKNKQNFQNISNSKKKSYNINDTDRQNQRLIHKLSHKFKRNLDFLYYFQIIILVSLLILFFKIRHYHFTFGLLLLCNFIVLYHCLTRRREITILSLFVD
ncbi:serine/threonine-protein kinase ulk3 [Anaeramoeba flamelloides]|uniref:Serine/threonine-protein kinase ulk3 n=1 Tax=Anaeramoeba flamelloides TaxID=1746091 RepID=A0AAV7ZBQ0_9EUKA|nr:serine/threonine-protein kinase ulk3 [Anaeramoeba flamelloides]